MKHVARLLSFALAVAMLWPATSAGAYPAIDYPTSTTKPAHREPHEVGADRQPTVVGARIVSRAMAEVGTPYVYGGMSPGGFDCSGFTRWVYEGFGITLPHSSSAQYALGGTHGFLRISSPGDLEPGDLVFQATGGDGVGHAGIYVGNGSFISATSSAGVQVNSLYDSYWGPLWVGGVRAVKLVESKKPQRRGKYRPTSYGLTYPL